MAISAIRGLLALIYLLGCLAMIFGAVAVVMIELITIAQTYGPGFGLAALVAAIYVSYQYRNMIAAPFKAWAALWSRVDARLG